MDLTPLLRGGALDFTADDAASDELRRALRAAGAATKVGLDPEAFAIDTALRPSPFPGLTSFEDDDADAAIFYGRSREISLTLEKLRQSRANGDKTPLMILGASGSGKSSLLKAGVIPRLRREAPAWAAIRAFRPGADPLFNLADALARTLADHGQQEAPGAIRRALWDAWLAAPKDERGERSESGWRHLLETLNAIGERIRKAAARPEATLLLGVDQAEELARAEGASGEALSDYLRATLLDGSRIDWRLAFTIRNDSLPELLKDPRFEGLDKNGVTLRALPVFRFNDVVEEPAKRYGVEIDHDLIDALMEDAPQSDALPLLAFAMQRLWRGFSRVGRIAKADYDQLGGMSGMLEDGAERALNGLSPSDDKPLPTAPRKALLQLGEQTFVPALAQVNDEGEAIRRVADWAEFSEEAKALLERFEAWRLVVRKGGPNTEGEASDTVEVAHEALFREWTRLKNWLEPERARLDALRGVHVATTVWERGGRKSADLTHFGQRLDQALELSRLERYAARLSLSDRAYIAAVEQAERRARRRRQALQGALTVAVLGMVGGSLGYAFREDLNREYVRATRFAALQPAAIAALSPGDSFRECAVGVHCPEMVVLPRGAYLRGSPEGVGEADEQPRLKVTIDYDLAVGKFEVSHDQWRACVATSPAQVEDFGCAPLSDSGFGFEDRPAINLSWDEAKGYIAWLNYMTTGAVDGPYRLLSEAEWEYAARGVTSTDAPHPAYFWGDDPRSEEICRYANVKTADTQRRYTGFRGDPAACEDGHIETSPVGAFQPNAFGLYDLSGNVWEWVEDCYHDSYRTGPVDGSAWVDDCNRDIAVLRGGAWDLDPQLLRSADRNWSTRDDRFSTIGFRVARTLAG